MEEKQNERSKGRILIKAKELLTNFSNSSPRILCLYSMYIAKYDLVLYPFVTFIRARINIIQNIIALRWLNISAYIYDFSLVL